MIDLAPFCAQADDAACRDWMRAPFSIGAHTYATDGRVMVRVPRRPAVPEREPPHGWDRTLKCFDGPGPYVPISVPEQPRPSTDEDRIAFSAHGIDFDAKYLARICTLPGLLVAPCSEPGGGPMPFRFDGGHGLLMPLRADHGLPRGGEITRIAGLVFAYDDETGALIEQLKEELGATSTADVFRKALALARARACVEG
jgi:hypothetical protein